MSKMHLVLNSRINKITLPLFFVLTTYKVVSILKFHKTWLKNYVSPDKHQVKFGSVFNETFLLLNNNKFCMMFTELTPAMHIFAMILTAYIEFLLQDLKVEIQAKMAMLLINKSKAKARKRLAGGL